MTQRETKVEKKIEKEMILSYVSLCISIISLIIAFAAFLSPNTKTITTYNTTTSVGAQKLTVYNISSSLITPKLSLSDAPVITQQQPFGSRLTNINAQLNSSELSIINNAPNSYFETAGEMYLNRSLNNTVGATPTKIPLFMVNGKPSVIYFGSITCVWCGANRWSMALALSRFGNFSYLFKGYSAIKDGDVPTLYWSPAHYNTSSLDLGSFYISKYINFLAVEGSAPITGGFSLSPISAIQQTINQTGDLAYIDAFKYLVAVNGSNGTPSTVWGAYKVSGADAIAFGNRTPTSSNFTLTYMTHEQLLQQIAHPSSQLAWTEYAGADFYVAMICKTINNVAPVCSLNAIKSIESILGP